MEKIKINTFQCFLPVPQCIPQASCTFLATVLYSLNYTIPIEFLYWEE